MKKKFAFVLEKFSDMQNGGGEPSIHLNCIKHFLNKGYFIDIFCEHNLSQSDKFNVHNDFSKNKEQYLKLLNKNHYDLIISSRFGLKFSELNADIYTIHSHSDLYSQKAKYGFLYNILKPKKKRIKNEIKNLQLNKDRKFIFCSKQLKEDYCRLCELKDTVIIEPYPNWTPYENYVKKENDIFTFGISATGFQNKGGYLALKSAFLLKLSEEEFKLKIIYKENGGFLQNLLVKILGLKKQVEFLPLQEDMHNFYENIDCLLMPSHLESFGMTAVEALAFGIPVIVSSTCGSKELIYEGENGFVFDFSSFRIWNLFKKMKKIMEMETHISLKDIPYSKKINDEDTYNSNFEKIIQSKLQMNYSTINIDNQKIIREKLKMKNFIEDILDIFIITFNRAKALDKTFEQILNDSSPIKNFEIKVIDNNSTDDTPLIVQNWQKKYPNIKYQKNKYNIGGNANIMKAFYEAQKKYVWILADNDFYNWDAWNEVEKAIIEEKDAIMVSKYELPTIDVAQFFIQTTFLPGVIYRKDLLNNEVMVNMAYNISNMFPHLAVSSKLINDKKDVYIVNKAIIDVGDNNEGKNGQSVYTRGYKQSGVHPLMKDLNWMAGFANSLYLISDKKTRNYIATHNLFYMSKFNSAEVFFLNKKLSNGSLYNLFSIFGVLNVWNKILFILNWILYYTLYRILYIYSVNLKPDKNNKNVYKQYRMRLFGLIRTNLFKIKKAV